MTDQRSLLFGVHTKRFPFYLTTNSRPGACSRIGTYSRIRSLFFLFQDVKFFHAYLTVPNVIVSANHSMKQGNLSPVHNGITPWVEVT